MTCIFHVFLLLPLSFCLALLRHWSRRWQAVREESQRWAETLRLWKWLWPQRSWSWTPWPWRRSTRSTSGSSRRRWRKKTSATWWPNTRPNRRWVEMDQFSDWRIWNTAANHKCSSLTAAKVFRSYITAKTKKQVILHYYIKYS